MYCACTCLSGFVKIMFSLLFYGCSEHSRHWFFKGRMVIDGEEKDESLFQMVMNTQNHSNNNNVIKFNDNSRYVCRNM